MTTTQTRHTLSVLVENKPGVLTRVAALFARRGFNIYSLAVGQTERPEISRITVVAEAAETPLEQVTKQLNKLVNVLGIVEMTSEESVRRRLVLYKVRADEERRTGVLQVVELFRAHVVDVVADAVTIEATGTLQKLEALQTALRPYGIIEIVQSGEVAVARGPHSIIEAILDDAPATTGA